MEDDDSQEVGVEKQNLEVIQESNRQFAKDNKLVQIVNEDIIEILSDDDHDKEVNQILAINHATRSGIMLPNDKYKPLQTAINTEIINEFEDGIKIDYVDLEDSKTINEKNESIEAVEITPIQIAVNSQYDISDLENSKYRNHKSNYRTLTNILHQSGGFVYTAENKSRNDKQYRRDTRKGLEKEHTQVQYAKENEFIVEYEVLEEINFMGNQVVEGKLQL